MMRRPSPCTGYDSATGPVNHTATRWPTRRASRESCSPRALVIQVSGVRPTTALAEPDSSPGVSLHPDRFAGPRRDGPAQVGRVGEPTGTGAVPRILHRASGARGGERREQHDSVHRDPPVLNDGPLGRQNVGGGPADARGRAGDERALPRSPRSMACFPGWGRSYPSTGDGKSRLANAGATGRYSGQVRSRSRRSSHR